MNSKWNEKNEVIGDVKIALSKMKEQKFSKRPKRIECTKEIYDMLSEQIESRKKKYNELIFLWGNPFDILFLQTDFSEWSSDDLKKGYKVMH